MDAWAPHWSLFERFEANVALKRPYDCKKVVKHSLRFDEAGRWMRSNLRVCKPPIEINNASKIANCITRVFCGGKNIAMSVGKLLMLLEAGVLQGTRDQIPRYEI